MNKTIALHPQNSALCFLAGKLLAQARIEKGTMAATSFYHGDTTATHAMSNAFSPVSRRPGIIPSMNNNVVP